MTGMSEGFFGFKIFDLGDFLGWENFAKYFIG